MNTLHENRKKRHFAKTPSRLRDGRSPHPAPSSPSRSIAPAISITTSAEGVIPEGEYGAATVMVWDRGTYRTEEGAAAAVALRKGQLKLAFSGRKLKGSWVLVRFRARNWLLMKHRDRYASKQDITLSAPKSVLSGRTLAQIAADEGSDVAKAAAGDPARPARRQ